MEFIRRGCGNRNAVRAIQKMLVFLGFKVRVLDSDGQQSYYRWEPIEVDGIFGSKTEAAVMDFQASEGILRDGIVGTITRQRLEKAYAERANELNPPSEFLVKEDSFSFVRVPADPIGEGYDRLSLRNDIAADYDKAYQTVHKAGGLLTSSGGRRSLNASVTASRSATSMHYLGRALDLYIYSGMVDPETDPYVISREEVVDEDTGATRFYHRVFARCSREHNPESVLPEERLVENVITYNARNTPKTISGHYLDVTDLFEQCGFQRIAARPSFYRGGSQMGAEWWHFQHELGLISGVTSFGEELMRVFDQETLEDTPPWKYKDWVFGIHWG